MENFMCHESLSVKFTQPLTCISGTNGSGKSSILTAIGILLGQRANIFDRGPNLKTLIMSGKEYFCITMVLNNHAKFREQFFKDKIFVEKFVTHSSTRMKIMNEKKEVYSTRICDFEDIIDLYSLDMSNPINFLTQDTAKKLLRSSKNEKLYYFFEKAVGIDKMSDFHNETKEKVDFMTEKIEEIKAEINKLEKDFDEKNEKLNFTTKREMLVERQEEIKLENMKLMGEAYKLRIQEVYTKIIELRNQMRTKMEEKIEVEEKIQILEEEKNKENLQKREENRKKEEKMRKKELNLRELQNEIKNLDEKIKMKSHFLSKKEKTSNENKSDPFFSTQEQREEKKQEMIKEKEYLYYSLQKETGIDDKISESKKQLSHLQNLKNNKLKFFSEWMLDIVKETERLGIIGPLANYIELKDEKWFKAASIVLKNELSNFIAVTQEQREALNRIFKKYNVNFKILLPSKKTLQEKKLIEFRSNKNYKTLLDVLKVKEPMITNQLIILTNLEQIILVEERKEAHEIIRSHPQNVSMAYLLSGDRVSMIGNSLSDFRARQTNFFFEEFNFEKKQSQLHSLIAEKQKRDLEVKNMKSQLLSLEKEIASLNQPIRFENEEDEELEEEIEQLKRQNEMLIRKKDSFLEINEEEKSEKVGSEDKKSKIEAERNTKTEIDDEITLLRNKFNNLRNTFLKIKDKFIIDRRKYSLLNNEVNDVCGRMNDWIEEVGYFVYGHLGPGRDAEEEMNNFESHSSLSNDFNMTQGFDIKAELKNISKIQSELEKEDFTIKANIKAAETIDDEKQLKISLNKIKKDLDFRKKIQKKHEKTIEKLNRGIKERMKRREEMRLKIASNICNEFKKLTEKRDYEGNLIFDHVAKTLDLRMAVDSSKKGSRGTLSGGERSFAGICFLLSLFGCSSCQLKCLDEFDVFMDNINRKMAIKLLQEYTIDNSLQVIVVTPLGTKDMFCDFGEIILLDKKNN